MKPYSVLIAGTANYTQVLLEKYLEREGFVIKNAFDGLEVIRKMSDKSIVMAILDVHLTKVDYIELCKQVRQLSDAPIVLLVEETEADLGIAGLDAGADTFIPKPIRLHSAIAQLKAVLRRREKQLDSLNTILIDGIEISYKPRTLRNNGKSIVLSEKEMELLWHLASQPRKVFSREYLLTKIAEETVRSPRLIDTYVKCIREKLKRVTDQLGIKTVWSIGYKLTTSSDCFKENVL